MAYEDLENPRNRLCPLCHQTLRGCGEVSGGERFACIHCGNFSVADTAKPRLFGSSSAETQIAQKDRIRLAWLVRDQNDRGSEVDFTAANLDRLLEAAPPRLTPPRAAEALLLWVAEQAAQLGAGGGVQVELSNFARHRADSPGSLGNLINLMIEHDWARQSGEGLHLRPAGWTRAEELKKNTLALSTTLQPSPSRAASETSGGSGRPKVFIVHGRDEGNLLRLERLLKTRWDLDPVILSDRPNEGRTLIEKFEGEVAGAAYGVILMTPDDQVEGVDGVYRQSRPNVIFELGYLCGLVSRRKTCILFKKGTTIHSDLAGIVRLEFIDHVDEKVIEIETELKAAGLVSTAMGGLVNKTERVIRALEQKATPAAFSASFGGSIPIVPPAQPRASVEPFLVRGSGQEASRLFDLEATLYVFKLEYNGEGNFIVTLMDEHGKRIGNLTNAVGNFNGSRAVRILHRGKYLLNVEHANGPWSATVGPPESS